MSKYKNVLLAGFMFDENNQAEVDTLTYELFRSEISHNAPFLIIFEKPLKIENDKIVSEEKNIEITSDSILDDPSVWKELGDKYRVDMIITGKIQFTGEKRQDIERITKYTDGKEQKLSRLVEKKFHKLVLDLYFIEVDDGKVVLKERLEKEKGYFIEEDQYAEIYRELFRDMVKDIKKLIISEEKPVQRTLLE